MLCCDQVQAPARAGALAPLDVKIPAQTTTLGPEKTSFFQALQIPTKITKGTIEILVITSSSFILQDGWIIVDFQISQCGWLVCCLWTVMNVHLNKMFFKTEGPSSSMYFWCAFLLRIVTTFDTISFKLKYLYYDSRALIVLLHFFISYFLGATLQTLM